MSELISIFVNNIVPVLLVAGAGYLVGRYLGVESRSISQLTFNIFSPALVFYSLYTTTIASSELIRLFLITITFQAGMAIIAYLVMRLTNAEKVERTSVMISSFCLNAGNFGLSVAAIAFGENVLALAVIVYVSNTILNYTLGVFVASSGRGTPRQALLSILRVPAVYATAVAIIFRAFTIHMPEPVFESIAVLKDAAIPSMLVMLGLQLSQSARVQKWGYVSIAVALRLLIGPLLGVALALAFQLDNQAMVAFLLQASMPTAVLTLILAKEFRLDETLTLNIITVSTLLSPFTLSILILLLRRTLAP